LKSFRPGSNVARIQQEVKLYGLIDHPLVTKLYDVVAEAGQVHLVLSYAPGMPLNKVIATGRLKISSAWHYACDILEGLAYLHSQHIVHRDIKPSNILILDKDDRAVISDLGIGKLTDDTHAGQRLTRAGELVGTPAYMPVEQIANKAVSAASDIYSAGAVLFEMLSGQVPFSATNIVALIDQIRSQPVPELRSLRAAVPEPLEQLVNAMLSKQPEARPSAMQALQAARDMQALDWAVIDADDKRLAVTVRKKTDRAATKVDHQADAMRPAASDTLMSTRQATVFRTRISDLPNVNVEGFLADVLRLQMEDKKQTVELFERRTKIWLEILGRETVATIVGGILLLMLVIADIVAFILEKQLPEILQNTLLLILGYFFGQTVARASKKVPK